MRNMSIPFTWTQIVQSLQADPLGTPVRVYPAQVEHPLDAGMRLSVGMPVGQRATYRLELGAGTHLEVLDFGSCYDARVWQQPVLSGLEATLRENPGSSVLGMVALGGLLGLALGQTKEAALAGAALGGLAGLSGVATASAETSPEVANVASSLANTLSQTMLHTAVPNSAPKARRGKPGDGLPSSKRRKQTTSGPKALKGKQSPGDRLALPASSRATTKPVEASKPKRRAARKPQAG